MVTRHRRSAVRRAAGATAIALLGAWGLAAAGTAAAADGGAIDCVQIVQIDNTRVIDDQNILFRLRGNRFYNNRLPHKCPGLKSAGKFSYRTSQSVLCNVDTITVLLGSGTSLTRGASCGLGRFTPTTDPARKDKGKEPAEAG